MLHGLKPNIRYKTVEYIIFIAVLFQKEVCRAIDIYSDEEKLFNKLFKSYNPQIRPVMNSSETVNASIQFSLLHIKELDVKSQVLTTTGLLILDWIDERLKWDPDEFGNLKELTVEARGLWKPEIAVINGAEKIYDNYDEFKAIIYHDGIIRWEPGGVFKTMCKIDITYYPFDEQTCDITFGAWSYHTTKMNLTCPHDIVNSDSYQVNGEWEIVGTHGIRFEFFFECCPTEKFSKVRFEIHMKRRHTFYIMNVILPSIMSSILLLSIFFCTPGQKVQIGVVVLLSFRIFLLNVADNIPKTSDHIPLLGIYLTCTMALTTLSMVLTVLILNLHHITDRPVPPWIHNAILVYLAPVIGICNASYTKKYSNNKNLRSPSWQKKSLERTSVQTDRDVSDKCTMFKLLPTSSLKQLNNESNDQGINGLPESQIEDKINIPQNKQMDIEYENEDYSKQWRKVAEVCDRLFFYLFLVAIIISTFILFHPLNVKNQKSVGKISGK